ncbi:hypothetical protein HPB50_002934 [Hyalomma asiaticum]|uniref:Uncharacterized protein n=1 Tax=Hyalomma asiaticum TaxID=266040 RepID=A0ACB7SM48_HYAAI|nr:hypothetical protein HPB50_002934 [Hyalomma asiaticum]
MEVGGAHALSCTPSRVRIRSRSRKTRRRPDEDPHVVLPGRASMNRLYSVLSNFQQQPVTSHRILVSRCYSVVSY